MGDSLKPAHLAVIMDGNGRWALHQKLARLEGHRAGMKALEKLIDAVLEKKIPVLTLFAFGLDNLRRPKDEVKALMAMFLEAIGCFAGRLIKEHVRCHFIGDRAKLSKDLQQAMGHLEESTCNNQQLRLNIAINYSGRWDITQAVAQCLADNPGHAVSETQITHALALADCPEPDLLIRTSGEQRLSNFMLWQCAYTEFFVSPVLWPDFTADHLEDALVFFAGRERRFCLTGTQLQEEDGSHKEAAC